MRCPYCDSINSKVVDKRDDLDANRRRRECLKCKVRFTTYERIELKPLLVKKKNNHTEEFSKEKLEQGIRKATEKRPIPEEKIKELLKKVERQLRQLKKRSIATRLIGKLVMHELKDLDPVAYIRFASVYQNFRSARAFESELKKLGDKK